MGYSVLVVAVITVIRCENVQTTPMEDYRRALSEYNRQQQVASHVDLICDNEDSDRSNAKVETNIRLWESLGRTLGNLFMVSRFIFILIDTG